MITFYNAGAGSGKTYTLSEQLLKFLTEQKGEPSQVILTTFTIKAAEELKERVRQKLIERGEVAKAAEMSNALIGTINAVCSQLVEKYSLEEGLPPNLRVMDQDTVQVFFEEFLAGHLPDDSYEKFSFLARRFSLYESTAFRLKDSMKPVWPSMVKALAEKFRSYGFTEKTQVELSKKETLAQIEGFLPTRTDQRTNTLIDHISQLYKSLPADLENQLLKGDLDGYKAIKTFCTKNTQNDFEWQDWKIKCFTKTTARNQPALAEIQLIMAKYYRLPEFRDNWLELTALIYDTAFELLDAYRMYKKERGLIDFADQETLLLKMINANPIVKQEIKSTFQLIMVDEFQDCSPIQLAIFSSLKDLITNSIWVGDPKQSIYGFRGADSELFNLTMNAVEKDDLGEVKILDTSYRSRPDLVEAVNRIFNGLFKDIIPKERIGLKPSDDLNKRENKYQEAAIQICFFEAKKLEDYYIQLASKIQTILASEMQVYDKLAESFRKIKGSDIALLFRSSDHLNNVAQILSNFNIEVSTETAGFENQAEVLWMVSLLRVLINPYDSLAIANLSLLEGTIENVEELISKRLIHLQTNQDEKVNWIKQSQVAQRICEQQQTITQMPLVQSIEYLISLSDLPRYCTQWGDFSSRIANLNQLIALANNYQEQCIALGIAATFAGFLSKMEEHTLKPASENEQAVQLLTIHGSKGLEWPMVIPVKADMEFNDAKILFNRIHVMQPENFDINQPLKGQQLLYLFWPFGSSKNVCEELNESKENLDASLDAYLKAEQEEDRLLYVALTRAKEYLLLNVDQKNCSYAGLNLDRRNDRSGLFNKEELEQLKKACGTSPGTIKWNDLTLSLEKVEFIENEEDIIKNNTEVEKAKILYYNLNTTESNAYPKRYLSPSNIAAELIHESIPTNISVAGFNGQNLIISHSDSLTYEQIGTCLHNAFAAWDAERIAEQRIPNLQSILKRWNLHLHIKADELDQQFNAFWHYLITTYKPIHYWKELPIQSVASNLGQVISGTADLVLETAEGLVLIDHKTFPGNFDKQVLNTENDFYAGKYANQLSTYTHLLEQSMEKEVKAVLLHYLGQGRIVELEFESKKC